MSGVELAACPFCGGTDLEANFHRLHGSIECNNCGCTVPLPEKSPEIQALRWNRRAVPMEAVAWREKVARIVAPYDWKALDEFVMNPNSHRYYLDAYKGCGCRTAEDFRQWALHDGRTFGGRFDLTDDLQASLTKADAILQALAVIPAPGNKEDGK